MEKDIDPEIDLCHSQAIFVLILTEIGSFVSRDGMTAPPHFYGLGKC